MLLFFITFAEILIYTKSGILKAAECREPKRKCEEHNQMGAGRWVNPSPKGGEGRKTLKELPTNTHPIRMAEKDRSTSTLGTHRKSSES